jgi:hypothetical protein
MGRFGRWAIGFGDGGDLDAGGGDPRLRRPVIIRDIRRADRENRRALNIGQGWCRAEAWFPQVAPAELHGEVIRRPVGVRGAWHDAQDNCPELDRAGS